MPLRVLVIDDDPDIGRLVGRVLSREGLQVAVHESGEMGLAALDAEPFDAVVSDIRLGGIDGIELCRRVVENEGLPVVLITAYGAVDVVRQAIRAGACDVLRKPFTAVELRDAVVEAVRSPPVPRNPRIGLPRPPAPPAELVGSSPAWRSLLAELELAARSEAGVLVVGESGAGKERVARALHRMSDRRAEPFVAVHCAAIPPTLLESELFGHAHGAFTGAESARAGLFVDAGRGTLFLDDIAALPREVQPKLLRAIQGRTVRPVGSNEERPFEARILAATNVDLSLETIAGRFRPDLLYRLDVLRLEVPPLRDRDGDSVLLARAFLAQLRGRRGVRASSLTPEAEAAIARHDWPGNVRELRNCIEAAAALAGGHAIDLPDLPEQVRACSLIAKSVETGQDDTLAAVERTHIERTLASVGGNRSAAADALGISRPALYRKLRRLGLE